MKKKVEAWLRQASVDLKSAEKLQHDADLTSSTAFHCQQCIEKCFKALIENSEGVIPRTHDLLHLWGLSSNLYALSFDVSLMSEVNEVYIDSRYPGDAGLVPEGMPSLQKTIAFVALARDIYTKIQILLQQQAD